MPQLSLFARRLTSDNYIRLCFWGEVSDFNHLYYSWGLLRVQSSELVSNLFQDCDVTKGDYHGLCKWVCSLLVLSLSDYYLKKIKSERSHRKHFSPYTHRSHKNRTYCVDLRHDGKLGKAAIAVRIYAYATQGSCWYFSPDYRDRCISRSCSWHVSVSNEKKVSNLEL